MKNLLQRIFTVLLLLPIVLAAFFMGGIYLNVLLGIVSLLSCIEVSLIVYPNSTLAKFLAALCWACLFLPVVMSSGMNFLLFLLPLFFILNGIVLFSVSVDQAASQKFSTIFYWSAYVIFSIASVYWLTNMGPLLDPRVGLSFVLLSCIATWGNDTGGYFFGRSFGKHPLFLRVSAKKTWEGFFGGAIVSIALVFLIKFAGASLGFDLLTGLSAADLWWVVIPAIVLAPVGDLVESRLKRLYDTKDSSHILPGHGGLLDRIDGLLMVVPWTALYAFILRPMW